MHTPDFSLSFSSTFSELNQSTPKKSREQNNNTSYNSRTSTQSNLEQFRQRLYTEVSQRDSEDEFDMNSSQASQASVRKKKRNLKRSLTSNSNTSVSSFETQSFTSSIIRTGKTMQRILEGDDSEDDFEDPKKSSKKSDNNQSSGKRRRKESVCNRRFETGNKSGSKNTPSTKRSFQHQSLPKARAQGKVIARTQPQAPAPPLPEGANSTKKRIFLNPFFTQPSTCGQNIQDAIKRNETCLSLSKQQKSKVTTPPQGVSDFPDGPQDNRCDDSLDLCQIPSYSGNKSQSKRINSGEIEDGPVINYRIFEKLVGSLRPKDIRFKSNAIKALQEGSEAHIVGLMEDAFLAALHAKRVTVTSEDLKLVLKIRNGGRQSLT